MAFLRQDLSSSLNPNYRFGPSAEQEKDKAEMIHLALSEELENVYYF